MPSTYTVNLGIEKPATGEQSGTWGDTTNVNFDIIDQAVNGSVRVTLTSAGTSGSPNDLNIVNGSTTGSEGRNKWIEIYSASDLGGSAYVRLVPNDAEKILFIRNSLAGSQSVLLFQGTYNASNDLEIPAGVDMVVKFDGAGASATVTDVFTKLRATEITTPTLTAGTADINGGSVDGATVGAASASTGAFTTLTASTSLNIASSTTVDGVLDEDNMASDSATKLATQQSIKAYVDSQVGTVDTWAEVLANGATSGASNPEIDSGQALKTNTINETTAGSGVTIDSVLLKDDSVNAATLEVSTLKANDGTAAGSIADSTGVVTLNSVDINGGNIDGTTIGATSTANGNFSTVNATDIETSTISANDGTTAINIADSTGAVDIDTSLNVDGTITGDGLTVEGTATIITASPTLTLTDTDTGADTVFNAASSVGGFTIDVDANNEGSAPYFITSISGTEYFRITESSAIFNEGSFDIDFRIESDANTHAFFLDASTSNVGINTPSNLLDTSLQVYTATSAAITPLIKLQGNHSANDSTEGTSIDFVESGDQTAIGSRIIGTRAAAGANMDLRFHTGRDDFAMIIDQSQYVGMGTDDPLTPLHLKSTAAGEMLRIESTEGSATDGPILGLHRNSGSPADGDGLGAINFYGEDSASNITTYGQIRVESSDVSNGTEDGLMSIRTIVNGTDTARLNLKSEEAVFNESGIDTDLRVESLNKTYMLFVDAGSDKVGIGGTTSPDALLHLWTQNSGSGSGGASGNADELLLENNSNCGLTILTENLASIHFGKEADNDIGKITYSMSSNDMTFTTNTAGNMTLRSDGDLSLSSSKHLNFNDKADMTAATQTTSTTAQTAIYSFSATTYTGAKLLVCVTDSTATERYITELLVTHDGTTAVSTEYGQVATDTALATFDVDISGGNVRLLATPASTNSMTFKVMSTQLLA